MAEVGRPGNGTRGALPGVSQPRGDGGAHYGLVCDASFPTLVLTQWARDAAPEQRFSVQWAIAELTRAPAEAVGLLDRGQLTPGMKADINIIDLDRLRLSRPHTIFDLPAGGRRLTQRAEGYVTTIVSGVVTYYEGEATGALPGRLIRRRGWTPLQQAAE